MKTQDILSLTRVNWRLMNNQIMLILITVIASLWLESNYKTDSLFSMFSSTPSLHINSLSLLLFFSVDLCILLPTSLFYSTSFPQLPIDSVLSLSSHANLLVWSLYSFTLSVPHVSPPIRSFLITFFSVYVPALPPPPIHISDNCGAVWSSVFLNPPLPLLCLQHTHTWTAPHWRL